MSHYNPYSHSTYLVLLITLVQIGLSTLISTKNKYETDSDTYWMSTSKFTPTQGATYAGVKRRKSMYLTLKFQYYGKAIWNEWENILRIGEYGYGNNSGCDEHGNRYPGLFILPSNNGLQISLSDELNCWFVVEKNYNLQENIIYFLTINYNQTYSTISISTLNATNNEIIEPMHKIANTSRTNDDSLLGIFMDIIISDPLTIPANVLLFDIVIISYDDILIFPGTTEVPITRPPRPNDDFGVEVTVAMDYSSNNTNKTDTDEVIREITEVIINNYMDQLNSSNDTLHVVISNFTQEYDIILTSDFTTNNETAVRLEAMFESELETEILNKLGENDGSITIQNIQIEITVIDRSNDIEVAQDVISTQTRQTTETSIVSPQKESMRMQLIWIIVIVGGFVMFCIFMIGFWIGIKFNGGDKQVQARSNISSENNVQSIQKQADKETEILNIRNTILQVMGTSGIQIIQPVNNNITHIQLNQVENMDENDDDEDEDEDMYNKYNYENTNSKYSKLYNNMTQQITEGGDSNKDTVHAIPYYRN